MLQWAVDWLSGRLIAVLGWFVSYNAMSINNLVWLGGILLAVLGVYVLIKDCRPVSLKVREKLWTLAELYTQDTFKLKPDEKKNM